MRAQQSTPSRQDRNLQVPTRIHRMKISAPPISGELCLDCGKPQEPNTLLQRKIPILSNEILAERTMAFLFHHFEADSLIDAAGGNKHVVRPKG